jgi:hypothetical protein
MANVGLTGNQVSPTGEKDGSKDPARALKAGGQAHSLPLVTSVVGVIGAAG